MKKILITGIKGRVGTILNKSLKNKYQIIGFDIPENNVTDFNKIKTSIKDFDVIIHLALDPKVEFKDENFSKDFTMTYNIYQVAKENKIKRVIMFSFIHADDYINNKEPNLKTTTTIR